MAEMLETVAILRRATRWAMLNRGEDSALDGYVHPPGARTGLAFNVTSKVGRDEIRPVSTRFRWATLSGSWRDVQDCATWQEMMVAYRRCSNAPVGATPIMALVGDRQVKATSPPAQAMQAKLSRAPVRSCSPACLVKSLGERLESQRLSLHAFD